LILSFSENSLWEPVFRDPEKEREVLGWGINDTMGHLYFMRVAI